MTAASQPCSVWPSPKAEAGDQQPDRTACPGRARKRCSRNARCSSSRTPPATITTNRNSQQAGLRAEQSFERIVGHVVQRRRERRGSPAISADHDRDHERAPRARRHAISRAAGRPPKNTSRGRSPRRVSSHDDQRQQHHGVERATARRRTSPTALPSAVSGAMPAAFSSRAQHDLRRVARAQHDLGPRRPGPAAARRRRDRRRRARRSMSVGIHGSGRGSRSDAMVHSKQWPSRLRIPPNAS